MRTAFKIGLCLYITLVLSLPALASFSFIDHENSIHLIDSGKHLVSKDKGQNFTELPDPAISGEAEPKVLVLPDRSIYMFWVQDGSLQYAVSKDQGLSWAPYKSSLNDLDAGIVDLKENKDVLHLLYIKDENLFYTSSYDKGQNFSFPRTLNDIHNIKDASKLFMDGDELIVCFISGKKIFKAASLDNGRSFSMPEEVYSTDNIIENIDQFNAQPLWLERILDNSQEIKFLGENEPQTVLQSATAISSLEVRSLDLLVFYQWDGSKPALKYIKNHAGVFGKALDVKQPYLENETFFDLLSIDGSLQSLWKAPEYKLYPLNNAAPANPMITNLSVKDSILSADISSLDPDNDAISYILEVCPDMDFTAKSTYVFKAVSPEAELTLSLPDATYYIRAVAYDGIASSEPSPVLSFKLDTLPPLITIATPKNNILTNLSTLEVSGTLSEDAALSINNKPVILNTDLAFNTILGLEPGENLIYITATDEAGNSTFEALSINFNADTPLVEILKPSSSDWFKKDATVLFEARVTDNQNDIEDEAEALLKIGDLQVETPLYYSQEDGNIMGFVNLPDGLDHGKHSAILEIEDLSGNRGQASIDLQIDDQAPAIIKSKIKGDLSKIVIPVNEEGSGLDLTSTVLSVTFSSVEVEGTYKFKENSLVFTSSKPLSAGTYQVYITPRDLAGNVGEDAKTSVLISPAAALAAEVAASDVTILSLVNGPNPFILGQDPYTSIVYELSNTASTTLYIFNLYGELIFKKELGTAASGNYHWDGTTHFSDKVSAGLYPYILVATDSEGNKEIKRSKIIVLK